MNEYTIGQRSMSYVETLENDRRNMEKSIERLENEIGKLARFIMENDLMPTGFNGSACECAIEIMKPNQAVKI